MTGFGLYIHWPFCAAKCPYCDFNSHVRPAIDEAGWCDAILTEMAHVAALQGDVRPVVQTIFFGGGTPSLMSGASTGRILDQAKRLWPWANDVEITLEANPASADASRFADYRAAGINRVSLGIQALNDADLKFLGRLHNLAEAKAALALAQKTFDRVSLDLIYARPNQTVEAWTSELKEALAFGTSHLSLYQLTIEPQTRFATLFREGRIKTPDEERAAALYESTQAITAAAGLPAYEVSNHARPGEEARHNLLYWHYGAYAGFGPGAHGRLALADKRIATSAEKVPERWMDLVRRQGHGFTTMEAVTPTEAAREHLLMNLRLVEGIDLADYHARWGIALPVDRITDLASGGLVNFDGTHLAVTPSGMLVLNAVIAELAD
jgi:oxygen-independent coproporphyrinogen-3 oxidase